MVMQESKPQASLQYPSILLAEEPQMTITSVSKTAISTFTIKQI